MKSPVFIVLASVATFGAVPALAECRRAPISIEQPRQRLDQSVQQLSRATGCFVRMDPAMVADRMAPAIKGRYSPEQALALLVRGTGYTAYATPSGLAFDGSLLAASMSQSRVLRTALAARVRAGRISRLTAAKLRATLDAVERDLPRAVDRQGTITAAQRRRAIQGLDSVRAAVGPVEDASGWAEFRHAGNGSWNAPSS